jgi:hypothetical protein
MTRFWTGAIAVAFALALVTSAQAGKPGGGSRPSGFGKPVPPTQFHPDTHHEMHHPVHHDNYFLKFAKKSNFGYFYTGRNHKHWSYCYWDYRYGCYLYWDPYVTCYYYYCVPAGCYYPASYCPYSTYCWEKPVGGVLPAPVASVPTVEANSPTVNVDNKGPAPAPQAGANLPPDLPPPPQGGPMVPVK